MHTDGLFALEDTRFVAYHTWLMKCRLAVQDEDVSVAKMSVHLLVDRGSRGV